MEIAHGQTWLKLAAGFFTGVGLVLAAGAWPPLSGPIVLLADLLVWPLDGQQTLHLPETRVLLAIAGGVMAGWGVTLWKLADQLLPEHLAVVRSITMTAVYLWFAVDSVASVMAGVPLNAVSNIGFLLPFLFAFRRMRQAPA